MNSHVTGKGMGLTQKSYENKSAIVKPGKMVVFIAGAVIPEKGICGVKYADGKIYPYNPGASDGTEIPRYFSDDGCKANDKVPFMRGGALEEGKLTGITVEVREKMMDCGFEFIKANKQYQY